MKKVIIALVTAIAVGCMAMVQPAKAGGVYDGVAPGSSILGVRLGLSNIVGVNATYDYALARVWKGTFTIGGQVGYMWEGNSRTETLYGVKSKVKYSNNYIDIKVRTTYRFNVVVPEWEVYAGVGIGGYVNPYVSKATLKGDVAGESVNTKEKSHGVHGGVSGAFILGTSYQFTDAMAATLEFDMGNLWEQSWVNLGINFKF